MTVKSRPSMLDDMTDHVGIISELRVARSCQPDGGDGVP